MRNATIAVAVAGSVLLAGCSNFPSLNSDGTINLTTPIFTNGPTVQQIQSGVATTCKFIPTAQTVADIIGTFAGATAAIDMVGQAVQGICAAITAKGVKRGVVAPSYRGIIIRGSRV